MLPWFGGVAAVVRKRGQHCQALNAVAWHNLGSSKYYLNILHNKKMHERRSG